MTAQGKGILTGFAIGSVAALLAAVLFVHVKGPKDARTPDPPAVNDNQDAFLEYLGVVADSRPAPSVNPIDVASLSVVQVRVSDGNRVGSGFFFGSGQTVLTASSLVQGATQVEITTADGALFLSEVAGVKPEYGLAVVRASLAEGRPLRPRDAADLEGGEQLVVLFANTGGPGRQGTAFSSAPVIPKGGLVPYMAVGGAPGGMAVGGAVVDGDGNVAGMIPGPVANAQGMSLVLPINAAYNVEGLPPQDALLTSGFQGWLNQVK